MTPRLDDDATLERALFQRMGRPPRDSQEPDWASVATELKRKGVTLVLFWQEYRAAHPDGYGYTWFCEQFRAFENRTSPSFRNRHEAGAVMQTDYAGHTIPATRSRPHDPGHTMPTTRSRSPIRPQALCIRRRSSSLCWAHPATSLPGQA